MIREVEGDILHTRARALAHGVAPNDDFHTGLALSIREKWPALSKDFRHHCKTSHPSAGGAWTWAGVGAHGPIRIVSLLTQEPAYGKGEKPGKAHLEHVNHALRELRKVIETEKLESIALPRLATGVGGLEWSDVRPLIAKHLGDLGIPVIVYTTYRKGVEADEGLGAKAAKAKR